MNSPLRLCVSARNFFLKILRALRGEKTIPPAPIMSARLMLPPSVTCLVMLARQGRTDLGHRWILSAAKQGQRLDLMPQRCLVAEFWPTITVKSEAGAGAFWENFIAQLPALERAGNHQQPEEN
jgi:hypothetical protein